MQTCMRDRYRTYFAYICTLIWICIACLCQACWMWMDTCCAQGIQMLLFRVRGFVPTALPLKQFFAIPWMYAQHVCECRCGTVLQIDMAKSTGYFRKPDIFRNFWGYQGCAWDKAKYSRKKRVCVCKKRGRHTQKNNENIKHKIARTGMCCVMPVVSKSLQIGRPSVTNQQVNQLTSQPGNQLTSKTVDHVTR